MATTSQPTSLTWERVSASHPCSICGRPDWCKRAGPTTICYRVDTGLGRAKTDSAGRPYWAYGVGAEGVPILPSPSVERADADTLHAVYSALLNRCPLRERHRNDLRGRGLSDEWIEQAEYGSLPSRGRADLAKLLLEEFGEQRLRHIPGCYVHEEEQRSWWSIAGAAGLLIPVRNPGRRIVALLARSDDPDAPARYSWVSSTKHGGAGPGSPIHVPSADWTSEIRVTEGVLKADVATALSGTLTLGLPGVSVHAPAVALCAARAPARVLLAFDADQRENLTVALALQRTMGAFREAGLAATLEVWDGAKGIDDALHAGVPRQVLTGTVADALLTGTIALAQQAVSQAAEEAGRPDYIRMDPEQVTAAAATAEIALRDGAALTEEQRWALAHLRHDHAAEWMALRTRLLGTRRVSIRELERSLPKLPEPTSSPQDAPELRRVGDTLPDAPLSNALMPQANTIQAGGIFASVPSFDPDKPPEWKNILAVPLLITAILTDLDTHETYVRLAWCWEGRSWRSFLVSRGIIATGRKLIELAGQELPVADTNSQDLVAYLLRFGNLNHKIIPRAWVSSHLGWQGKPDEDASFLYGRTQILPNGETAQAIELDGGGIPEELADERVYFHTGSDGGSEQLLHALKSRGTLEAWKDGIAHIAAHPRALLALYAAFGTPLLEILDCPNFAVDFSCGSSSGKTTLMQLVASVWGSPDERGPGSLIGTFDSTQVGIERRAHMLNGLPLILDETKRARNPALISPILYEVTGGQGRVRGNPLGLAKTPTWHTILFSTGEDQITSFSRDGGARTRTLCVTEPPFGARDETTGELVGTLTTTVMENHGHAGPAFVAWMMQQRDQWPKWREWYHRWTQMLKVDGFTAETGRLAQYAALIQVAGTLAHQAGIVPFPVIRIFDGANASLWSAIAAEAQQADNAEAARDYVRSWADGNENAFWGRGDSNLRDRDIAGRWDRGEDWEFIGFLNHALDRILTEGGFNPHSIKRAWKSRKWIQCEGTGFTIGVRGCPDGKKKLVKLLRSAFPDDEGDEWGQGGLLSP